MLCAPVGAGAKDPPRPAHGASVHDFFAIVAIIFISALSMYFFSQRRKHST
jgi:hypothetical protein